MSNSYIIILNIPFKGDVYIILCVFSVKMLQVSGNLKLGYKKSQTRPEVIGLVAECRRIESSSIIELTIPQVMFTSTTTMDLKILSVDTK